MAKNQQGSQQTGLEVAVIGMACRIPGAKTITEFWENLKNGVESITFFSEKDGLVEGPNRKLLDDPGFIKACGLVENSEFFDPSFFGFRSVEAEFLDPQIRVFYECTWEALENAGYDPYSYEGLIGLYTGGSNNRWWELEAFFTRKVELLGSFAVAHLVDRDFLSTRIAHGLNLRGPAITLKTACSTSLVAVDLAYRALLTGQCQMAIAGGVSIARKRVTGYRYQAGMVHSPDGHCRAFDAQSQGTIFSDGAGVVVLKRLKNAIKDRDTIYAVIKGSAVNNDGSEKSNYQAPCVEGQAEVIRSAIHMAEVDPETISYVETHGTGTVIGDPIEIEGLKKAFKTSKKRYCAVGSVKTNLGHLDAAAGIAGFIKTVLALTHRLIPPSLHFERPNPKIDFDNSPFFVNSRLLEWNRNESPLRAGVSSFGVGGTNAHIVLEEPPLPDEISSSRQWEMILVSARSESALDNATKNLETFFKEHPHTNLADAAFTLQVGRKAFACRRMVVATNVQEATNLLAAAQNPASSELGKVHTFTAREKNRLVFMFPGQGAQYVNMGRQLYEEEVVFREELDRCFEFLKPIMGYDLKEILYPPDSLNEVNISDKSIKSYPSGINRTEVAQPLLFAFEYALAKLLMKWGIKPYAMIGHSIGEYTAACLSGVFSLEDALSVVALRGKLMQQMPAGAMLGVSLPEKELKPMLQEHAELTLAAINAPAYCVISGPVAAVEALEKQLKAQAHCRRLHTSHAFHSSMMDPVLKPFEKQLENVSFNKPILPYISNVTGKWITIEQAVSPAYWAVQLRKTVQFCAGLGELLKEPGMILLEVGPGQNLSTFARKHPDRKVEQEMINLVRHPDEEIADHRYLLDKIGLLWLNGVYIDWQVFYEGEKRRRIPLPHYPFEKKYFSYKDNSPRASTGESLILRRQGKGNKANISRWFYTPSWKRSNFPLQQKVKSAPREKVNWLLFANEAAFCLQLEQELVRVCAHQENHITVVREGSAFSNPEPGHYTVNPQQLEDYLALIADLKKQGQTPRQIFHLWSITKSDHHETGEPWENLDTYKNRGFFSLVYLVQALNRENIDDKIKVTIVSNHLLAVTGDENVSPVKATVLGPVMVIPREYQNIFCRLVDITIPAPGSSEAKDLLTQLIVEIQGNSIEPVIAIRKHFRYVVTYESISLESPGENIPRLKRGGVYLITGGTGGIGLVLAQHLSRAANAGLILIGRTPLPPKEEWDQWLCQHSPGDKVSIKISKIKELEKNGSHVMAFCADVCDRDRMQVIIDRAEAQMGPINGVIHAAGIPGGGMIQVKTREQADQVMAPKVKGTLVLNQVLNGHLLDFFILCSSINSVLPVLGQVDYFAANAFLDTFAYYKTFRDRIYTVSINWDTWQEVGMAVNTYKKIARQHTSARQYAGNREQAEDIIANDALKNGLLSSEGIEAFNRILGGTLPQVVVSTRDLRLRLKEKSQLPGTLSTRKRHDMKSDVGKRLKRPTLSSTYVAPRTRMEQFIVPLWEELLGIEKIGIHDNFFELGGDSLSIVQMNTRLKKILKRDIPVAVMFRYLTIESLARYLQGENDTVDIPGANPEISRSEVARMAQNRMKKRMNRIASANS